MRINSYKKGRIYEDSLSAYGKRQPGSGSMWSAKEDILGSGQYSSFLIQAKNASGKASYGLKLEDLKTLRLNASKVGRTGFMIVNYGDGKEYVILRRQDFDHLFTKEQEETEDQE